MVERAIRGLDLDALVRAREKRRMTRADLARLTGLSTSTIQKWESGATSPNIETLAKAAAALGVPMRRIIKVPTKRRTLADWRRLSGLSRTKLARAAGLTTPALAALERGESQLTDEKADRIAPHLKATHAQLHAAWQRARERPPGTPA
ncbi:transcriptional regulator, XRE family [Segniliparus rotundus DSM 44985]|uniref:Transcriptional regulator, XRE family n=1 Tax=Segniliparus rotundus (strain ATCC BAA-972 / CDC 1076 / CIP 108378 / DSM 44985 / JCM 13578) TaxID=640132 RepID=D6ZEJ4_SEGRD|nr:helix-turn-helix transcriptional regulator [Segniliparus rotundus]ADG99470.1 transcriptional regulator, XRE family [Segniliparus rotundus DSM 44985]